LGKPVIKDKLKSVSMVGISFDFKRVLDRGWRHFLFLFYDFARYCPKMKLIKISMLEIGELRGDPKLLW